MACSRENTPANRSIGSSAAVFVFARRMAVVLGGRTTGREACVSVRWFIGRSAAMNSRIVVRRSLMGSSGDGAAACARRRGRDEPWR